MKGRECDMMTNLKDADNQVTLDELKEVLNKCQKSDCVSTLKKFLQRADGSLNQMDLQQKVLNGISAAIYLNDDFIYVTINADSAADLKSIKAMWETMLQRGTECTLKGETNDYALVVDLIHQELENNTVYTLSFVQPVFASLEDDSVMLAFGFDNIFFGKETLTLDEIEYTEETEKDMYEYDDIAEESQFNDTDEFIGTDKYIS